LLVPHMFVFLFLFLWKTLSFPIPKLPFITYLVIGFSHLWLNYLFSFQELNLRF
jgi:hypothetical protein